LGQQNLEAAVGNQVQKIGLCERLRLEKSLMPFKEWWADVNSVVKGQKLPEIDMVAYGGVNEATCLSVEDAWHLLDTD
jgi:hypothetical protein